MTSTVSKLRFLPDIMICVSKCLHLLAGLTFLLSLSTSCEKHKEHIPVSSATQQEKSASDSQRNPKETGESEPLSSNANQIGIANQAKEPVAIPRMIESLSIRLRKWKSLSPNEKKSLVKHISEANQSWIANQLIEIYKKSPALDRELIFSSDVDWKQIPFQKIAILGCYDVDVSIRLDAVRELDVANEASLEALRFASKDEEMYVRRTAAEVLAKTEYSFSKDLLLKLMRDEENVVSGRAIMSLSSYGASTLSILLREIQSCQLASTRANIAYVFKDYSDMKSLAELRRRLRDVDEVSFSAELALAWRKYTEGYFALIDRIGKKRKHWHLARMYLEEYSGIEYGEDIHKWRKWVEHCKSIGELK